MDNALIGTLANDFFNGTKSARLRGYGDSKIEMLEDKTNGIGDVSFQHRRYGTDAQQPYDVEYSIDGGANWINIGSFTSGTTTQTFSQTINVAGNVRIRIKCAGTGTTNKRTNIDDIILTDYVASVPILSTTPSNLNGFITNFGIESTSQSYDITGTNLVPSSGNVTITGTTDFEISTDNITFTNSLTLPYTSSNLTQTTIYVRINSSANIGTISDFINNDGGGTSQNVQVDGFVCNTTGVFNVGDISIIGFSTDDPDAFSFVNWVDIPDATELSFTENAWTGSELNTNEGTIVWQNTTGTTIPSGTVITYTLGTGFDLGTEITSSGTFALSVSQDNLFIYEGTNICPSFIFGFTNETWINSGTPNTNNSYLPTSLNVLNGNISTPTTQDNWEFNLPRNDQSSIPDYKSLVNDISNWTSNNSVFSLSSTDFTIATSTPSVEISSSAGSGSESASSVITITATSNLPVVGDQTISLTISGLGITNSDYTLSNNTITILNNQTTGTVTFTIFDDNEYEGTETATISFLPGDLSSGLIPGVNTTLDISIVDNDAATFYSQSSGGTNSAIWDIIPNGVGQTAASLGGFSPNTNIVIQSGHQVDITVSGIDMNDLLVENGSKFMANDQDMTGAKYIRLYGDITNNGDIGNGSTPDNISIEFRGTEAISIGGTGNYNIGRIRKESGSTGIVTINSNMNLGFIGTCIYNNNNNSTYDIIISAGKTVTTYGDVSFDGTNGLSTGERGGNIIVNGTLEVGGKILAISNNSSLTCSITIENGGKIITNDIDIQLNSGFVGLTLNNGSTLEVNGIMSVLEGNLNANGSIIINDGATLLHGTGTTNGGGSVSGNIIVKRQGTQSNSIYNYWSTPVSNGILPGSNKYAYDSNLGNQDPSDDQNPDPGWFTYNSPMNQGIGYASTGGNLASFIGQPNNGNINIPLVYHTYNPGSPAPGTPFNLIGNPYPGAIDANSFVVNNSDISGSIYFWDDDLSGGSGYSSSDYAVWNTIGSIGGGGGNNPNGHVASCQGFMVRTLNNNPFITFTNQMRESGNNDQFFRMNNDIQRAWLSLSNNLHYNEILVATVDDATDDEDRLYDAVKFSGNANISLSAMNQGLEYSIIAFSPYFTEKIIPLNVFVLNGGIYTFNLHTLENFDNYSIYLEDNQSNWYSLEVGTQINVSLQPGTNNERFFLHFVYNQITNIESNENNISIINNNNQLKLIVDKINIEMIEVISIDGKSIFKENKIQPNSSEFIIDLNSTSSGIYIMRIIGDKSFTYRFFKN